MKPSIIVVTSALLLASAVSFAARVNAQSAPAPQHVLSRGLVSRPDARPATLTGKSNHIVFGRLESVAGRMLSLRTRSGRLWSVDATDALASGNYSAPLFVGKIVEVDGSLRKSGVIQATGIMRMGTLDRSTPPDR